MIKPLIEHLRRTAFTSLYSTSMSPAATQQILSALTILMGEDGTTTGISHFQCF